MDNSTPNNYLGTELPSPKVPEQPMVQLPEAPNDISSGEVTGQTEKLNMEIPAAPAPVNPATNLLPPLQMQPVQPIYAQQNNQTQPATTVPTVLAAEDSDLIEKEWVVRAKSIVNQTRYDPREQNKAINKVKAEYIKRRYNKDIKVAED